LIFPLHILIIISPEEAKEKITISAKHYILQTKQRLSIRTVFLHEFLWEFLFEMLGHCSILLR